MSKKYLYFKSKGIAIPLEALQACADLRFIEHDYDEKKGDYVYFKATPSHFSRETIVIDESQILAERPKEIE